MKKRIADFFANLRYALMSNSFGEISDTNPIERQVTRVASPDEMPVGSYYFVPPTGHYKVSRVLYRGKDIYNDGRVFWVFCVRMEDATHV